MLPSNASEWETVQPKKDGPRISGGLVLTVVLLVALIGVIAFAVLQMPTARLAQRPSAAVAPTAAATAAVAAANTAAGAPADAATEQAIQAVIRKLDDEQSRAIATNDQNLMADTSTPEFLAQQIKTNQELVSGGVTEIKLVNIEFGQVTVSDNSANATAYETWTMTFDDGSTAQARDRNDYTLIKDSARGWVVQADDHPDQRSASTY